MLYFIKDLCSSSQNPDIRGFVSGEGRGILKNGLYGQAPYPYIYHFDRKGTPFVYRKDLTYAKTMDF